MGEQPRRLDLQRDPRRRAGSSGRSGGPLVAAQTGLRVARRCSRAPGYRYRKKTILPGLCRALALLSYRWAAPKRYFIMRSSREKPAFRAYRTSETVASPAAVPGQALGAANLGVRRRDPAQARESPPPRGRQYAGPADAQREPPKPQLHVSFAVRWLAHGKSSERTRRPSPSRRSRSVCAYLASSPASGASFASEPSSSSASWARTWPLPASTFTSWRVPSEP